MFDFLRRKPKPEPIEYPYLCDMCYPEHKEIGKINPLLTVVVDKYGMYYICWGEQGHRDSLYMMQTKPWPDPCGDLSDDELEALEDKPDWWEEFLLWEHKASIDQKTFFYWIGSIENAHFLIETISKYNYSQDNNGYVWFYIFHEAGKIIQNYESASS
jgi:hypothetical protein